MEAYSTICPGCGLGCGLYLLRDSEKGEGGERATGKGMSILHRKQSAVNAGKLCKFGMQLPHFYSRERLRTAVGGKNVSEEEAVKEARERLTTFRREEIAFLAMPSTVTNEEALAFLSLVSELECENFSLGFERFFSVADFGILFGGMPLEEVERAEKVLLFFLDPFVQYPLLARRILRAKQRGARVVDVSFAENERAKGIYDETILAEEIVGDIVRDMLSEGEDLGDVASAVARALVGGGEKLENSLILADLNPLSPTDFISAAISLAEETKSQILFLKPFLNANGANLLSAAMNMRGRDIFEILNDVKEGKIKCLFLLETDLLYDGGGVDGTALENLEFLVVQDAFKSAISEFADITICSEPLFLKKGTVVNVEGRVLSAGGDAQRTVEILERISGAERTYKQVQEEVCKHLGISKLSEYESFVAPASIASGKKSARKVANKEKKGVEAAETSEEGARMDALTQLLWQKTSPFFWHAWQTTRGTKRSEAIVEVSPSLARLLNLFKGEMLEIRRGGESKCVAFRIAEIPSYLVISADKITKDGILVRVEVEKAK